MIINFEERNKEKTRKAFYGSIVSIRYPRYTYTYISLIYK